MNAAFLPFNDSNLMMMYKKIYKGEYRCPKWMSSDLRRLLSRLLDTKPETRITVDEIKSDPWFKKGFNELKHDPEFDSSKKHALETSTNFSTNSTNLSTSRMTLNAFDIISFSSGLNLTTLFDTTSECEGERVVVAETAENVIRRVEEMVKEVNGRVAKRKEFGVDLIGRNGKDVIGIEVFRLTENLVVVEVQSSGGGRDFYDELWNNKIRSELVERRRDVQVAGS